MAEHEQYRNGNYVVIEDTWHKAVPWSVRDTLKAYSTPCGKEFWDLGEATRYADEWARKEGPERAAAGRAAREGLVHLSLKWGFFWRLGNCSGRCGNPAVVSLDTKLLLVYEVNSELDFGVPVWLGANIWSDDGYFYNVKEDVDVTLRRDRNTFERHLTLDPSWRVGEYQLQAEIWYGPRSQPDSSVTLAHVSNFGLSVVPQGQGPDPRPNVYHEAFWRHLSKYPDVQSRFKKSDYDWKKLQPRERDICEAVHWQAAVKALILHDEQGRLIDPEWPAKQSDYPDWVDVREGVAPIPLAKDELRTTGGIYPNDFDTTKIGN